MSSGTQSFTIPCVIETSRFAVFFPKACTLPSRRATSAGRTKRSGRDSSANTRWGTTIAKNEAQEKTTQYHRGQTRRQLAEPLSMCWGWKRSRSHLLLPSPPLGVCEPLVSWLPLSFRDHPNKSTIFVHEATGRSSRESAAPKGPVHISLITHPAAQTDIPRHRSRIAPADPSLLPRLRVALPTTWHRGSSSILVPYVSAREDTVQHDHSSLGQIWLDLFCGPSKDITYRLLRRHLSDFPF